MPLSREDHLQIVELYARYAHAYDNAEADRWADVFTPDATFTVRHGADVQAYELHGTAELAALVRDRHSKYGKRGIRHALINILADPTEYGASGTAYFMEMRVGDGQPPQVTHTGRYVDELVKGASGWQFRCKTVLVDA